MDASIALRAIRKGWYLVLLGMLGAVSVAVTLQATAEPYYEATSSYIVTPAPNPDDPAAVQEAIRTLDDARARAIVATYTEILESGSLHAEAAAGLSIGAHDPEDYEYEAVILPEANVVTLTVRGPAAEVATLLSGAVGAAGSERFGELYQIYKIVQLDAPVTPTEPANPPPLQTAAMAGAAGILIGAALALLFGAPKVRREERRQQRLLSYTVTEEPSVVTPLRHREDRRAAGSG